MQNGPSRLSVAAALEPVQGRVLDLAVELVELLLHHAVLVVGPERPQQFDLAVAHLGQPGLIVAPATPTGAVKKRQKKPNRISNAIL